MKSLTSSKSKWQNKASMVHQKSKEASLEQDIIQKAGAIINLKNPMGLKEFKLTPPSPIYQKKFKERLSEGLQTAHKLFFTYIRNMNTVR